MTPLTTIIGIAASVALTLQATPGDGRQALAVIITVAVIGNLIRTRTEQP